MEISLKQPELEQAIKDYVETMGVPLTNKEVIVVLKAGRGDNGHTAHIEILPVKKEPVEEESEETPGEDDQGINFGD